MNLIILSIHEFIINLPVARDSYVYLCDKVIINYNAALLMVLHMHGMMQAGVTSQQAIAMHNTGSMQIG